MAMKRKKAQETVPVLVTTEYRGVFFGDVLATDPLDQETLTLRNVRNAIYWSSDVGGFAGLAETGPSAGCRIGATLTGPIHLHRVTSVAHCTLRAVQAWRDAEVYRG